MKRVRLIHFRRCHMCDHTNIKRGRITRCESCNKSFAPFFYFDDKCAPEITDNEVQEKIFDSYHPLRGFTSYW